jgi:peptide/nickel transport system ATP-binding protein
VVERAPVAALFAGAQHPYTRGLLRSVPSGEVRGERAERHDRRLARCHLEAR